jgi:hypothetical protein
MEAYEILKKYNVFNRLNNSELEVVKEICKNNVKLKRLANRYTKTGSNRTLATMLETFDEIYPNPTTPADLAKLIDSVIEVK